MIPLGRILAGIIETFSECGSYHSLTRHGTSWWKTSHVRLTFIHTGKSKHLCVPFLPALTPLRSTGATPWTWLSFGWQRMFFSFVIRALTPNPPPGRKCAGLQSMEYKRARAYAGSISIKSHCLNSRTTLWTKDCFIKGYLRPCLFPPL